MLETTQGGYASLKGKCPRCEHEIIKGILPVAGGELLAATAKKSVEAEGSGETEESSASETATSRDGCSVTPDDGKSTTYLVTCNCVFGHRDAPEGVRGCGWQAAVRVTSREGERPKVEQVTGNANEWDDDEYVERASRQQLQQVRQFAGQWTAMLGVVTGFLAVGTFFDFTRKDLALQGLAWIVYAAAALVALAAAVASVAPGFQAAGLKHFTTIPADTGGRMTLMDKAVKDCRLRLSLSRWGALVAVIALAVAVGARLTGC